MGGSREAGRGKCPGTPGARVQGRVRGHLAFEVCRADFWEDAESEGADGHIGTRWLLVPPGGGGLGDAVVGQEPDCLGSLLTTKLVCDHYHSEHRANTNNAVNSLNTRARHQLL